MNRLLMAAARGARIQFQYWDGWRDESDLECIRHSRYPLRVNPDDEHLMFGPISRVFRGAAEEPHLHCTTVGVVFEQPFGELLYVYADDFDYIDADDNTRSLWLLIMAEALADIGV